MKKIISRSFLMIFLFTGIFKVLEQVNWISILKIEDKIRYLENKTGDIFLNDISQHYEVESDSIINHTINTLFYQLCISNKLNSSDFKIYLIKNQDINAIALPGKNIVINSGLISKTESEAEMAGIIAHEIAHIKLNHVSERFAREAGLTTLIFMSTGNTDIGLIHNTIKLLATTALDRESEFEADQLAVKYLINANFNPVDFSKLLLRISTNNTEPDIIWLSTHPASIERANKIILISNKHKKKYFNVFSKEEWQKIVKNKDFSQSISKLHTSYKNS